MNRKRLLAAIIAALLLLPGVAFCQQADGNIIGIENGVLFAYNINTGGVGVADEMSIHLTVADSAQTGFAFVAGDGINFPNFTLFKLQYFLNQRFGINIVAGSSGVNMATGVGLFFNLFRRNIAENVVTILKLKMDYLINVALGIQNGLIVVGISGKIGM